LLPDGATIVASPDEPDAGDPAVGEPMHHRLMVEAPGAPRSARFLHVVQGADGGTAADAASLLRSSTGSAYEGVALADTAVLFRVDLGGDFTTTTVGLPSGVTRVFVTGLAKGTGYRVETRGDEVVISTGGETVSDSGGVLSVTI
jgi:hypothetical protein